MRPSFLGRFLMYERERKTLPHVSVEEMSLDGLLLAGESSDNTVLSNLIVLVVPPLTKLSSSHFGEL